MRSDRSGIHHSLPRRALLGAGATGLATLLLGCKDPGKPGFKAIDITGADYAQGFRLPDAQGAVRELSEFKGKAVVVFFGFTQCPDVCPTTLSELVEARKLLDPDGERVQGVFITVDPERDTSEVLKAYMTQFDPSFVGLRGSVASVEATAKAFKVYFKKVDGKAAGSYTVDHTAASFVFDPQGRIRLYTRYGLGPAALAEDLRVLLNER